MSRRILPWAGACALILAFCASFNVQAQRERILDPVNAADEGDYGRRFFEELSRLFGRFRDTELRRAFQQARRIECTDLISGDGEWRSVAFFNDDRKLGDWYRTSLEEVNSDPSRYIFKGSCGLNANALRLTTKFPVLERVNPLTTRQVDLEDVDVNVNAPVDAVYDPRTQGYSFDLPYLYLIGRQNGGNLYSLIAPSLSAKYASDMTYHWDCKAVLEGDVTYRFLICRATTLSRLPVPRGQTPSPPAPGSSAYFILSDGKEANSEVNLAFGDSPGTPAPPPSRAPAPTPAVEGPRDQPAPQPGFTDWQPPEPKIALTESGQKVFRIAFNVQTWRNRISSPQILGDQKISVPPSTGKPAGDVDYCAWQPASTAAVERLLVRNPDEVADFSISPRDRDAQGSTSIAFNTKTHTGLRLGTLTCYFPQVKLAADVTVERWIEIVGGHLTIEVLP